MAGDPPGEDEARATAKRGEQSVGEIPEAVLELDPVFDALSHPRRRYVLYSLRNHGAPTLRELARSIAAWEYDVDPDALTESDVDEVYVSLYHAHVPKLVDSSVVAFDPDTEQVRPAEHAEQVQAALTGVGDTLDSRQEDHARQE